MRGMKGMKGRQVYGKQAQAGKEGEDRKGGGIQQASQNIYSLGILPSALCDLIPLIPTITPGQRYATDKETEGQRE